MKQVSKVLHMCLAERWAPGRMTCAFASFCRAYDKFNEFHYCNKFLTKVSLNLLHDRHSPGSVNEVDGEPRLAETPRPSDSVEVRIAVSLAIHVDWKVKVHHNSHLLNVNTCNESKQKQIIIMLFNPLIVKIDEIEWKRCLFLHQLQWIAQRCWIFNWTWC